MSTTRSVGTKEEADLVLLVGTDGSPLITSGGLGVVGNVAHDAADSGYPVKIGGKAETTAPTAVQDGDRVDFWADEYGRQVVALKHTDGTALTDATGVKQAATGTVLFTSTPTLSVAGQYASGDYIGPTTTPASIANVVRASGAGGLVKSLVMTDKVTTAAVALELWLFSASFTAPTDNAAWAITDAEALTCIGVIPILAARWYASSNNKVYTDDTLGLVIQPGVTTLYYALVARATTPTWANGDLQIGLGILQA